MLEASVLPVFRYASPVLSALCFLGFSIYSSCHSIYTNPDQQHKVRRRPSLLLSWAIVAAYLVQSILDILPGGYFSKSSHIHTLSQVLFWTTLALSLSSSPSPVSRSYFAAWVLSLSLEIINVALSLATSRLHWPSFVLQLFSLLSIALLSVLDLLPHAQKSNPGDAYERRALMAQSPSSENVPHIPDSASDIASSDTSHDVDSEAADEESDEKFKQLQKERLRSTGGWIGYVKEFGIFWPYIWPANNPRLLMYIVLLSINILITRVLHVLAPRQLGIIIDRLATEGRIPWLDVGLWALFGLLASESTGFEALNAILSPRITTWSFQRLTAAAFDHVMLLSMDFHDEKDSGEIIKALEQANSLNSLLRVLILDVVPGVLDLCIALWYVAYLLDGYAVLIVVAVAMAITFSTSYLTTFVSASRRDLSARERDSSRLLYEKISNWAVVSYFNRMGYEKARLAGILKGVAEADIRSNDSYTYLYGAMEFCERLGEIGIIILAACRISQGLSPIGTFIAVESYWETITMPLYVMGHSYRQLTSDLIDAERLLQLFASTPTVHDVEGAEPINLTTGNVEFDDVCFGYSKDKLALDHINFRALSGQTVALIGETGSGKSTILELLMRFYNISSGRILIDGQDIRCVTQHSLRDIFGVVPQETVLFNTTVLENLRYAKLDASDEEVFEACRAAAIHEKILTFDQGYHTKVGERGIKLSGGEMQRLSIARVILKRPRIVLLDEATSAIDTMTETKIQTALRNLTSHQTTFVIAHRLSTIVDADLVLVIDQGRIVEKGTHQQLLQHGRRYRELWTKQVSTLPT